MTLALDQFATQLVASQLVSADELREFVYGLPDDKQPQDGGQLARELVRHKRLTPYQATQIYLGKLRNLSLGNYRILDRLGQGGMGLVLKAEHKLLKRLVAIKVLSPEVTKNRVAMERFQREVETAAKLSHPNIVAAYDADEDHKTRFLVFEYVEGIDLANYVEQHGPLPVELALNYLHGAAKGLEYAHQQGVIHRDIKPSNLLLDHLGTVRLLDMGLARLEETVSSSDASKQASLTQTGMIMGTVDFMAPEQAENMRKADARSDLYSLGISFYYLLTGKNPYAGETFMERILAHREWPIPSIRAVRAEVDEEIDALFRKMVAKRPADRYQSMSELIAALAHCMVGEVNHRITKTRAPIPIAEVVHFVPPPLPADHPSRSNVAAEPEGFDWSPASRIMGIPVGVAPVAKKTKTSPRRPSRKLHFILSGVAAVVALCLVGWSLSGNRVAASVSRPNKTNNKAIGTAGLGTAGHETDADLQETSSKPQSQRELATWALSDRGTIQIETDAGVRRSIGHRREIPKDNFVIRELSLMSRDIEDSDIERLIVLQGLESLSIPGSHLVTNASAGPLGQLERLTKLHVSGTELTVAGLSGVPQLRELGLDAGQFAASQIKSTTFPELRRLDLIGMKESELQQLVRLSIHLEGLVLTNSQGSRTAWNSLFSHFSDLTDVQIADSNLGDGELGQLVRCKRLAKVTLTRTRITDAGLKEFARVKTLKSLNLRNSKVTPDGVKQLRQTLPLCKIEV